MPPVKVDPDPVVPSIKPVDIGDLEFDPENPRLPIQLRHSSASKVINWMLNDASLIELLISLGEQGYFGGEPLLVVPASKTGKYIVVEGNRRLAATLLLNNPGLAETRKISVKDAVANAKIFPKELPVTVYPSRNSILEYLGFRHITGVKAWEPIAKARFLNQLYAQQTGSQDERCRRLAKLIGTRREYVLRLLIGLKLVEEMIKDPALGKLKDSEIEFSLITTAVTFSNILAFIGLKSTDNFTLTGLNKQHLAELGKWMYIRNDEGFTRLGDSRNLKHLNKVVEKAKALEAFRKGDNIYDALRYTSHPYDALLESIAGARSNLSSAQESLALIDETNAEDLDKIDEVRRLAADVKTLFQARVK